MASRGSKPVEVSPVRGEVPAALGCDWSNGWTRCAGQLAPGFEPRRLANLAWTTAHGLLSLVAGMEQVGGATRHTLTQLRNEACLLLRRTGA